MPRRYNTRQRSGTNEPKIEYEPGSTQGSVRYRTDRAACERSTYVELYLLGL